VRRIEVNGEMEDGIEARIASVIGTYHQRVERKIIKNRRWAWKN
jgi:hypothetical protein